MIKVIDLFAGCGGLSCGFEQAGLNIVAAVEYDKQIAKSYEYNHKNTEVFAEDIKIIDEQNIFSKDSADIIIGGPPCQGFSMAGARIRNGFIEDPRNYLFKHYLSIVNKVKPKMFIIENVKGIQTMKKGQIFGEIISQFENIGYKVHYKIVKATNFGVPQLRERMIIIGVLNQDFDIEKLFETTKAKILKLNPDFFNTKTVWETIKDLEKVDASKEIVPNHIATKHNQTATKRMSNIKNGKNFTSLKESITSVHSGSYGRLEKDKPATTITTRFDTPSGGKYIHPSLNRTITPREAARIQSFPDDFVFIGNKTSICKQIGNAVPPKIGFFLAELTKEVIKNGK